MTTRFQRTRRTVTRLLVQATIVVTAGVSVLFAITWFLFPLPDDFLHPGDPGALILDSSGGVLLDVVGADEQRRLAIRLEDAGPWIPEALIAAEDRGFRRHLGVDPLAIVGAFGANANAGRVVRGGSTITMQVAGLRLDHPRTYLGKAVEAFRALQIEARHDKDRILEEWLNTAPFGGNLVGVETASRAWLGKPAGACTLAESALLVALPNAPERLRPDRHPEAATARKNLVLARMLEADVITVDQYREAVEQEILIQRRHAETNERHAGWLAIERSGRGRAVQTTIDPRLQSIIEDTVELHAGALPEELDIAVVLVELETASIRALVGSSDPLDPRDGRVNGAIARRSPGSALKPLIYAQAYDRRRLAPDSIVIDAPLEVDGWRPRNIDHRYRGEMTAGEALRTSRNTPALRITRELGLESVVDFLRRTGIDLPSEAVRDAGLSIAVGGVEVRPIDLAEAYTTLARGGIHQPLRLIDSEPHRAVRVLSEAACIATEHSLAPDTGLEAGALPFVAAKTGTSSGFRDAVAAGWNARHAVVVWVGRFDGGSDPSLLGARTARPILQSILTHPVFSTGRPRRPVPDWVVRNQVGAPSTPVVPRIIEPRVGDRIVAHEGFARIDPQVFTDQAPAVLLLDGRPIPCAPVTVGLGPHELRIISGTRDPHAIRFEVVPPPGERRPLR
jgi:penicillin-binding protein 1C